MNDFKYIISDKYHSNINEKNIKSLIHDLTLSKKGYPRDYIIGYVNFWNCKIDLSLKPLIPRVETEFWIEKELKNLKIHFKNIAIIKVLDIFSGSGCLGISIAKNFKNSIVDFSDVNENYLKQIKINLKINNIKNYKKVIKSDIFAKIPGKYDLILANPPYVPTSDTLKAPFEDRKAITAGKDGLKFLKPFLAQLKEHLNSKGICIIEHHPNQVKELKTILLKHGFNNFEFRKDQYLRFRYLIITI